MGSEFCNFEGFFEILKKPYPSYAEWGREKAMKVFQYVIMLQSKKPEEKSRAISGTPENPIVTLTAKSEREVQILAQRAIPVEYLDRLDEVEVVVRPFC